MDNTVYMVHLIHWGDCCDDAEEYLFFGIFTSNVKAQAAVNEYIGENEDDYWDWTVEPVIIDKTYRWER